MSSSCWKICTAALQGQVLNQTSSWWMGQTEHIVPNALLSVPDPNAALMQKCDVFPVEFIVRGFLTGEDCTKSTNYKAGIKLFVHSPHTFRSLFFHILGRKLLAFASI